MDSMLKVCTKCAISQPLDNYYSKGTGKKMSYCKTCAKMFQHNRYYKDVEKAKIRNRETYLRFRERNPENLMLQAARRRAKLSGHAFTITKEDIIIPNICPLLGIPIYKRSDNKPIDNSPSIDRIDNSKGYTPDNIQIISWKANRMKSDFTLQELEMLVNNLHKLNKN